MRDEEDLIAAYKARDENLAIQLDSFVQKLQRAHSQEKRNLHLSSIEASVPLGRYATPNDVAKAVAFLSSEESSFITGTSLNVSGGIIA